MVVRRYVSGNRCVVSVNGASKAGFRLGGGEGKTGGIASKVPGYERNIPDMTLVPGERWC